MDKKEAWKNEGEGSRTAAEHYNQGVRQHVQGGKASEQAKEAEQALEGREGRDLKRAEEIGKSKAKH